MKPAPFQYAAPETVDEAVMLLSEYGRDGKILAGGQSLVPLLAMRLARPSVLIDLNRIAELDYIRQTDGEVAIGAMTRQRTIERSGEVREHLPLWWEAVRYVGHPQIRNRGTVGGSLAHADPSAELPAAAAATGATLVTRSTRGERTVSAEGFFLSYLATALEPDELLVEVRIPAHARAGTAFLEVARRHGDYALAGVAAMVTMRDGRCEAVRLAFTGVGPVPVRVAEAEEPLIGRRPEESVYAEIARIVAGRLDPDSDIHASAAYRKDVAGVLTARALALAVSRAQEPMADSRSSMVDHG
ncbi:MAG TPA: xanthine dehydrogenase family protein subunit M [bacterium]|jgi:CO/xanthine dehydrogenase FAD-binding subunit|nr:xanthine dehydrogenase family protein subunit M [bacterium]